MSGFGHGDPFAESSPWADQASASPIVVIPPLSSTQNSSEIEEEKKSSGTSKGDDTSTPVEEPPLPLPPFKLQPPPQLINARSIVNNHDPLQQLFMSSPFDGVGSPSKQQPLQAAALSSSFNPPPQLSLHSSRPGSVVQRKTSTASIVMTMADGLGPLGESFSDSGGGVGNVLGPNTAYSPDSLKKGPTRNNSVTGGGGVGSSGNTVLGSADHRISMQQSRLDSRMSEVELGDQVVKVHQRPEPPSPSFNLARSFARFPWKEVA